MSNTSHRSQLSFLVAVDPRDRTKIIRECQERHRSSVFAVWYTLNVIATSKEVRALTFTKPITHIAADSGLSYTSTIDALNSLKGIGLLTWMQDVPTRRRRPQGPSTYTLHPTTPPRVWAKRIRGSAPNADPVSVLDALTSTDSLKVPKRNPKGKEEGVNGGSASSPACLAAAGGEQPPKVKSPDTVDRPKKRYDKWGDLVPDEGSTP